MDRTVTIIIPFYNCMNTLPRMLDSILSGTVLPHEIILVDDGSDDGSLDTANRYAQKYDFIRVLTKEHSGVSASRNLGIKSATGYWISFLDADDYIEPDTYETMLETIAAADTGSDEDSRIDGCICGYFTHKDGVVTPYQLPVFGHISSGEILRLMFTDESVKGFLFTRLFKASLLKDMSFDREISLCEDLLFQSQLFSKTDLRFCISQKPLYHYIQHSDQSTTNKSFFIGKEFIYRPAYKKISEYVKEPYVAYSYNAILEYSMYTLLMEYKSTGSQDTLSQIRLMQKELKKSAPDYYHKSKRRIGYELAPVITGRYFIRE